MSAFEQAVRVGVDAVVHVKSAFYWNETRCGLGGVQGPKLEPTDEAPTCAYCKRERAR